MRPESGRRRLALVGGAVADPLDTPLLLPALVAAGWDATAVSWHDDAVDWSSYDVVLLRSCWDYVDDASTFLTWLDGVAAASTVLNSAAMVRWNADKSYLLDLAADGVPVVPTSVVTATVEAAWPSVPFVVKPAIGGGSRLVGHFTAERLDAAKAHLARLTERGGRAVIQPFLAPVDRVVGETDIYVVGGDVTHAVTKSQVLEDGAAPAEDFHLTIEQDVRATAVRAEHRAVALQAVSAVQQRFSPPLYARIDVVDSEDGPLVLEAELIEPALFLDRNPHVVTTFVTALARAAGR